MFSEEAPQAQPPEEVAIRVENLGKCYRIFDTPKDRLKQSIWRHRRQYFREFWALRDVNFSVSRGESLGIIGHNGSGKSTLLQIICGTLLPSTGSVHRVGRVAALLELGSGFNPEFSGIENIYLNGSLLGLSRPQVEARLDDILAFADIGDFVHQPVKTYSSGMALRLAFAVIAHVDASILVVDEALAVGDIFFVQKCLRFIHRFKEENILLLVTHDTQSVLSACSHGIVLSRGHQLTAKLTQKQAIDVYTSELYAQARGDQGPSPGAGPTADPAAGAPPRLTIRQGDQPSPDPVQRRSLQQAIEALLNAGGSIHTQLEPLESQSFGNGAARIREIQLRNRDQDQLSLIAGGEPVQLVITADFHAHVDSPILGFAIRNEKGLAILGDNTYVQAPQLGRRFPPGQSAKACFSFTMPRLAPGRYTIHAAIASGSQADHQQLDYHHDACSFEVISPIPCHALICPSDMAVDLVLTAST